MSSEPRLRVLVVDDTDHVRTMLVTMLELDGFAVAGCAQGGAAAVASADDFDPHVVVIDYKMPGPDGLTTARALRQARPNQVIVLYSAYLDRTLEEQARAAGVAVCVGKVEGLTTLERHITELCRDLDPAPRPGLT
jgi:CheY-like chemotaxis protein